MNKVIVTTSWDDGHALDMKLAALLRKYGLKGTFYISPLDNHTVPSERLSPKQIQELSKDFEIGAHTMTHPNLLKLSYVAAEKEILDSKLYLEKIINRPVTSFCYPSGRYNKQHVSMVKRLGFTVARTIKRFSLHLPKDSLQMETSVHAYNHWSDLWGILRFSHFNPVKFLRYYRHWDELAIAMFERVSKNGGVFHIWGHSWEISKRSNWDGLERVFKFIMGSRQSTKVVTNSELTAVKDIKSVMIVMPYSPIDGGGLENYAFQIATRLKRDKGWRVTMVFSGPPDLGEIKKGIEGITTYQIPYQFKLSNSPISLKWFARLKAILHEENPDIVNIHVPVPGIGDIAALVCGSRKVVLTYHAGSMKKGVFLFDLVIWLYENIFLRLLISRSNLLICSSDYIRNSFLKKYTKKSITISPAADTSLFVPKEGQYDSAGKKILFVAGLGHSEQHKGLRILLDSVNRLKNKIPDISLDVVGDGGMKEEYIRYVKNLGIEDRVTFHGRLSGEKLVNIYQNTSIFSLPTSNDSYPTVLIEAMACGIPVVSTTVGSIADIVTNGENGFLVSPHDTEALSAKIELLLKDQSLSEKISKNNREKTENYLNWQTRVERYSLSLEQQMQEKKRLLLLASGTINSSLTFRLMSIAKHLVSRGYDVAIIAPRLDKYSRFKPELFNSLDGVKIIRPFQFENLKSETLNFVPYILLAIWTVMTYKSDLVYLYKPTPITVMGVLPKIIKKIPLIVDIDDLGSKVMEREGQSYIRVYLVFICEKVTLFFADTIVVVSSYLKSIYDDQYPHKRITVVSNGADRLCSQQLKVSTSVPKIVLIGSLSQISFLEPLIRVLPDVINSLPGKEVRLITMGGGEYISYFKDLVKTLGIDENVSFLGWIKKENFYKYINAGDIGYCYSQDSETNRACSNQKVFDYMSYGVIPLVSGVGDLPEYVEFGSAGIVAKNETELKRAIVTFFGDDNLRKSMAEAVVNRYQQKYTWNMLVGKIDSEIKAIL